MKKQKITKWEDKIECSKCYFRFGEEYLGFLNGRLLCQNCEKEVRDVEKI